MGRLIDADKLEAMTYDDAYSSKCVSMHDIDAEPTAYDPEKVVEQLEDYGNEEMHYYKGTPYEKCIEVCIGKAIEIVKGGGVDG